MKKLSILVTATLALGLGGCGNDSVLSNIGGASLGDGSNNSGDGDHEGEEEETECHGDGAAQEAALHALAESYCAECNNADGTAEELQAQLNPQDYTGGPLEVGLVIGSPNGLANVTTHFSVAELEITIGADQWKLSEDGTRGRVVLFLETGLPTGEYFARLKAFEGEAGVDSSATWLVGCPDEPSDEPGDEPTDGGDTPAEEPPAE